MASDKPIIGMKEAVLVEDWLGEDADARREGGAPPDRVYESTTWYDLSTGAEITDPETVRKLEENARGPD